MSKKMKGTREWAARNYNIQNGCSNNCAYCYAACNAIRFKRTTEHTWQNQLVDRRKVDRTFTKYSGTIMFPSSHDVTPENIDDAYTVLANMLDAGNNVLLVSKPRLQVINRLCELPHRDRLLMRFSIGSCDDKVLRLWEPGAPSFGERMESLRYAHARGFRTSLSCEPMLDGNIAAVVEAARPYVTEDIWIGKANRLRNILALTRPGDTVFQQKASELIAMQSDDNIIELYNWYKGDELVRWKDSVREVLNKNGIQ